MTVRSCGQVLTYLAVFGLTGCLVNGHGDGTRTTTNSLSSASPRHAMSSVVAKHFSALVNGLRAMPSDDPAWTALAEHATHLHDSGHMLLEHSAATSDDTWAFAASNLEQGSVETLTAVAARDFAAARSGAERLNEACVSCHHECEAVYGLPWRQ
ncbi:MAG: hypothetical protein ACKVX7_17730 [Planctomycetota bacterium]